MFLWCCQAPCFSTCSRESIEWVPMEQKHSEEVSWRKPKKFLQGCRVSCTTWRTDQQKATFSKHVSRSSLSFKSLETMPLTLSQGTSQWICGNAQLEECARDQLVPGWIEAQMLGQRLESWGICSTLLPYMRKLAAIAASVAIKN